LCDFFIDLKLGNIGYRVFKDLRMIKAKLGILDENDEETLNSSLTLRKLITRIILIYLNKMGD